MQVSPHPQGCAPLITDSNGQFAGMASATLESDRFLGLLKITHFAPDTLTGLTHSNGQRTAKRARPSDGHAYRRPTQPAHGQQSGTGHRP